MTPETSRGACPNTSWAGCPAGSLTRSNVGSDTQLSPGQRQGHSQRYSRGVRQWGTLWAHPRGWVPPCYPAVRHRVQGWAGGVLSGGLKDPELEGSQEEEAAKDRARRHLLLQRRKAPWLGSCRRRGKEGGPCKDSLRIAFKPRPRKPGTWR